MNSKSRSLLALIIVTCLLAVPVSAIGKKGKDHYDRGMKAEQNQQWEQAAQEFTLALAADPSNVDYRLHYQRAIFNASQMFMQKGRSLAEQRGRTLPAVSPLRAMEGGSGGVPVRTSPRR